MGSTRILVAEGNHGRFQQVRSLLEGLGYGVVAEPAGPADLLDQVVRHAPDLVLVSEPRTGGRVDEWTRAALRGAFSTPLVSLELGEDPAGAPAGQEDPAGTSGDACLSLPSVELWRALAAALPAAAGERGRRRPAPIGDISPRADAVVLLDGQGRITHWGASAGRIFGYAAAEALGRALEDLVVQPGERERCQRRIGEMCGAGAVPDNPLDLTGLHRDGRLLRVRLRVMPLRADGQTRAVGVLRDLGLSPQVERELDESRSAFRTVTDKSPDGILIVDGHGVVQYLNPAAADLLGRSREAFLGQLFGLPLVAGESAEIHLLRSGGEVRHGELRIGNIQWQGLDAHLVMIRDITLSKRQQEEQKALAEKLKFMNRQLEILADADPLTDMLNRRGLMRALEHEMGRGRRQGAMPSVIFMDFDDFKRVNDRLGHPGGDMVLREVSARIRHCARRTDYVARVGGDEFLVLLPETRCAEAVHVAERIRLAVGRTPVHVGGTPVQLTVSMGVVPLPYDSGSLDEVISLASRPLRASKRAGKNAISVDRGSGGAPAPGLPDPGETIVGSLVKGRGLYAVAQPILRLSDERVVAHELLSRSRFQVLEMPDELFQYSRENEILPQVDMNCLRLCLEASRRLSGARRYHVNLFPSTLLSADLDLLLQHFPAAAGGGRFCVEINEQQVVGDPGNLRGAVQALRAHGIQVAIDDVGFGRSSLESLVLLEPDVLKIDKRFVTGVAWSPGKKNALGRLCKVGKALGAQVIAEGVETREDLWTLRELGIEYGQGFLWSQPEEVR